MLLAALGVGLLGVLMEVLLLRRIYRVPELFQLLATFGVVLAVQDLVLKIWGPLDILGSARAGPARRRSRSSATASRPTSCS